MVKNQGHHRTNKIYWRGFAFKDLNRFDCLSICNLENFIIDNKPFLWLKKEANQPGEMHIRYFEAFSSKSEKEYRKILRQIDEGKFDEEMKPHLLSFICNLLIRQTSFQSEHIAEGFKNTVLRKELINELVRYRHDKVSAEKVFLQLQPNIAPTDELSPFVREIWNHLMAILNSFTLVILRAPSSYFWSTSDCPVSVDRMGCNDTLMIPIQSEIYFPLSRKYLAFLSNKNLSHNQISKFPANTVSTCSHELYQSIIDNHIIPNANEYLIYGNDFFKLALSQTEII
ncbi:DUF4238 domain-containing protein [Marinoscillum sp.]|uniref:DUF4238 domain-containing protein n=1 Tax=Marinoscillum sp. TaxID=2024838 RepID=UPI003BA8F0EC